MLYFLKIIKLKRLNSCSNSRGGLQQCNLQLNCNQQSSGQLMSAHEDDDTWHQLRLPNYTDLKRIEDLNRGAD